MIADNTIVHKTFFVQFSFMAIKPNIKWTITIPGITAEVMPSYLSPVMIMQNIVVKYGVTIVRATSNK